MNRRVKNFIMPILCASLILCAVITVDQISRASDKAEGINEVKDVAVLLESVDYTSSPNKAAVQESQRGAGITREYPKKVTVEKSEKKPAKEAVKKQKSTKPKKAAEKTTEKTSKIDPDDLYVLAHVIDGEGRGEDDVFKWLVGAVVLNRVKSDIYPNTIKDVVFQRDKWGVQYACAWDGNYNREPEQSSWDIAELLLTEGITEDNIPKSVTYQSADPNQGKTWTEYKCKSGVTCYFCHNKWIK